MPEKTDEMTQAQWDRIANKNVELVKKAVEYITAGDGPSFLELIDNDIDFRMNGTTPFSGKIKGIKDYTELLGRVMEKFEASLALTIDNLIPAGDWVVTEMSGDAKTKEGVPYRNSYCMIWRFKDGKVDYMREYNDSQMIMDILFSN